MKFAYCSKCKTYEKDDHQDEWFQCDCKPEKKEKNWIDKVIQAVNKEIKEDK